MLNTDLERIRFHATQFRVALENCGRELSLITLHNFPRGACGDAALLLAKYLKKLGHGEFDYVCGVKRVQNHDFQSHAWLKQGVLIIDITADQFDEIRERVLLTTDHRWHEQFYIDKLPHRADYDNYDEFTKQELETAYEHIVSCITTHGHSFR